MKSSEVQLARNWSKTRVLACLASGETLELSQFLNERYEDRFLGPIEQLRTSPGNSVGYGFAVMSLCCLLVETIESYRKGWPSSHPASLKELENRPENGNAPPSYKLPLAPPAPSSSTAFTEFFKEPEHQKFFPGVAGTDFYKEIRCGLLHQAQTKNGWRITRSGSFWDSANKTINRNEFANRTRDCLRAYVKELEQAGWTEHLWVNASRKIWWTAQVA